MFQGRDADLGGLFGLLGGGTISNCYATGDVGGDGNQRGALLGGISTSTGAGIIASAVSNCYATGSVTAGGTDVGGFGGGNIGNCQQQLLGEPRTRLQAATPGIGPPHN